MSVEKIFEQFESHLVLLLLQMVVQMFLSHVSRESFSFCLKASGWTTILMLQLFENLTWRALHSRNLYSGNLCIIFFLLHDGILLEADVRVHQILDFNITVVTRTGTNRKTNLLCSRHVASVLDLFTMVRKYFPGDFKFCYKITLKKIQGISSYLYPQPLHKTVGEPP